MTLEAPPPSRHISSQPISLSSAARILETYIMNSERHPHLHPDALIIPSGVTFSSHGGPMGGVVVHNLRRLAAGLRGEYLEPEGTPDRDQGTEEDAGTGKREEKPREEWQDKAEYEQEEGVVEVGEIGPRATVVQAGGEEPDVEVTGGAQDGGKKRKKGVVAIEASGKLDKEARKKAKRERNKQQRIDNEMKRAAKAE